MTKRKPPTTTSSGPLRPLNTNGLAIWNAIPTPVGRIEAELLQHLCEQIDERETLRQQVAIDPNPMDRRALRELEDLITIGLRRYQLAGIPTVATGDNRISRLLTARDQLTAALSTELDSNRRASLTRELRLVLDRLEELAPTKTESKVDELAARRTDRNTVTSNRASARSSKPPRSS